MMTIYFKNGQKLKFKEVTNLNKDDKYNELTFTTHEKIVNQKGKVETVSSDAVFALSDIFGYKIQDGFGY